MIAVQLLFSLLLATVSALTCKQYHAPEDPKDGFNEVACDQGSCFKMVWVQESGFSAQYDYVGGCAQPATTTPAAHVTISGFAMCREIERCIWSWQTSLRFALERYLGSDYVVPSSWDGSAAFRIFIELKTTEAATAISQLESAFANAVPYTTQAPKDVFSSREEALAWLQSSPFEVTGIQGLNDNPQHLELALRSVSTTDDGLPSFCNGCTEASILDAIEREMCQAAGVAVASKFTTCRQPLDVLHSNLYEYGKRFTPDCNNACFCFTQIDDLTSSSTTAISSAACTAFPAATVDATGAVAAWQAIEGGFAFQGGVTSNFTIELTASAVTREEIALNAFTCSYGKDSEANPTGTKEMAVSTEPEKGDGSLMHYHCCDYDLCNTASLHHSPVLLCLFVFSSLVAAVMWAVRW